MRREVSRRSLLAGAGYAVAGTAAGQLLCAAARAQQAEGQSGAGGICLSMLFESGQRARFDSSKYVKNHLPLLRKIYGDSVERIELRLPAGGAAGMAPMLATTTLWIRDVPAFSQLLGANAPTINADLDTVARGNRIVQPDRIVAGLGEERGQMTEKTPVISLYYRAGSGMFGAFGRPPGAPGGAAPAGGMGGMGGRGGGMGGMGSRSGGAPSGASSPGSSPPAAEGSASTPGAAAPGTAPAPKVDPSFLADEYLPKLFSLYGSEVIRRIEGMIGMDQQGQKATQIASYHAYIRDRGAYDKKSATVFTEMSQDVGTHIQGVTPVIADLRLTAIA